MGGWRLAGWLEARGEKEEEEEEVASQGLLIPEGWWCSQDNKLGCHGNQLPFQHLHQPPNLHTHPASPFIKESYASTRCTKQSRLEKLLKKNARTIMVIEVSLTQKWLSSLVMVCNYIFFCFCFNLAYDEVSHFNTLLLLLLLWLLLWKRTLSGQQHKT